MPFPGAETVRALSIDLDNTLWDIYPTLVAAEQAVTEWLQHHCPAAVGGYTEENVAAVRRQLLEEHPDRSHDLSFMRRKVLERILDRSGCDSTLAEPAFQVFFAARNRVTLFEDVVPALTRLRERYVLVALTDGNACLNLVGLGRFFHHYINAAAVGAPKPHGRMFEAVLQATGLRAHEIAHVGDDPEKDVAGARRFGFHAVWINRAKSPWPSEHRPPDAELDGLAPLADGLERRG